MTDSLVLEVPEHIYQPLAEEAAAKGRKVEEIALERLVKDGPQQNSDPFAKFIGAFNSQGLDWSQRRDEYPGENLRCGNKPRPNQVGEFNRCYLWQNLEP